MPSTSVNIPSIKCPFECKDPTTGKVFEWTPRVPNPKKCVNCGRVLAKANKIKLRKSPTKKVETPISVEENVSAAAGEVGDTTEQVVDMVPDSPPLNSIEEEVEEHVSA